jgi:WD40 repeat protein
LAYLRSPAKVNGAGEDVFDAIAVGTSDFHEVLRVQAPPSRDDLWFDNSDRLHVSTEPTHGRTAESVYDVRSGRLTSERTDQDLLWEHFAGFSPVVDDAELETHGGYEPSLHVVLSDASRAPLDVKLVGDHVRLLHSEPGEPGKAGTQHGPIGALPMAVSESGILIWTDEGTWTEDDDWDKGRLGFVSFDPSYRIRYVPERFLMGGTAVVSAQGLLATVANVDAPLVLVELPSLRVRRVLRFPGSVRAKTNLGRGSDVSCLGFSPDGSLLGCASNQGALRWFDTRSGKLLGTVSNQTLLHGVGFSGCQIGFSRDGRRVIFFSWDGVAGAFDAASSKILFQETYDEKKGRLLASTISNDFRMIFTLAARPPPGSLGCSVELTDLETGARRVLEANRYCWASMSNDGRFLTVEDAVYSLPTVTKVAELPQ